MRPGALEPYEDSLVSAQGLQLRAGERVIPLDVRRWLAPSDDVDATVLARCVGPVLDIGCGPGRFVRSLAEHGVPALGVDIAETAVRLTRESGAMAVVRDVFTAVPAEGRWPTVLLMDGNVGIGGDVTVLLDRIRSIVSRSGSVIVETDGTDEHRDERLTVRFVQAGRTVGPPFGWAEIGATALRRRAQLAGYAVGETWSAGGRSFSVLARA